MNAVPRTYGAPFSAHDALRKATPVVVRSGFQIYKAVDVPKIDLVKLVYFAISIFWRGTLSWNPVAGGDIPGIKLSYRHKEALRQFLLSGKALPLDVVLTVVV